MISSLPSSASLHHIGPPTVELSMASAGNGSVQHAYGELFKAMADVNMLHVPYRGGTAPLADLVSGHVQVMFDTLSTSIEIYQDWQVARVGSDHRGSAA